VTALIFLNTSEKCKSTSSNVIQIKKWQKTISTEEILDVIHQLEKGEQTVDLCHYVRVIHSSVQFKIMLIELKKELIQEPNSLCSMSTTVLSE